MKNSKLYAWVVLLMLIFIRVSHGVSQSALSYVFSFQGDGLLAGNPKYEIRAAFPQLFANYGLLSGPAFSVSNAISGIFVGMLVDKANRKTLLAVACLLWSITSLVTAQTNSFAVLCFMRFLLGICVSATDPTAFSILGDYFPKKMRTTANSFMTTACFIGYGLSTIVILLIQRFGWRQSYTIIGSAGILMSIVGFLVIKEPERGI